MNGPRSTQQRDIMLELRKREDEGRGAQSAKDFVGFPTRMTPADRGYLIGESSARSVLERLVSRQLPLVERVGARPRCYRLTAAGRESIS